jgi:hypothetical protein
MLTLALAAAIFAVEPCSTPCSGSGTKSADATFIVQVAGTAAAKDDAAKCDSSTKCESSANCDSTAKSAACGETKSAATDPMKPATYVPMVKRIGGDMAIEVKQEGDIFTSDRVRIDTPLPLGYPRPTPPGAIEIKSYPVVRRAEVVVTDDPASGSAGGFWPLFRHIQSRKIAMTAPVEMDLPDLGKDDTARAGKWTMSFLYREMALGETGKDGMVNIVDLPPLHVISVGFRGPYGGEVLDKMLKQLDESLASQKEWEREPALAPRLMGYNGPEVSWRNRWGELQIPVRRVSDSTTPTADVVPVNTTGQTPKKSPAVMPPLGVDTSASR